MYKTGMYVAWWGRSAVAEGRAEVDLAVIAQQNVRRTNSRAGSTHQGCEYVAGMDPLVWCSRVGLSWAQLGRRQSRGQC